VYAILADYFLLDESISLLDTAAAAIIVTTTILIAYEKLGKKPKGDLLKDMPRNSESLSHVELSTGYDSRPTSKSSLDYKN
jgi:hypothetical protein